MSIEIRALIKQMATANPYWGAPRIHGELLKLGIEVSERTVSRLMPKRQQPPSQTWKAFLNNHVQDLVSIDFFTVPTVYVSSIPPPRFCRDFIDKQHPEGPGPCCDSA